MNSFDPNHEVIAQVSNWEFSFFALFKFNTYLLAAAMQQANALNMNMNPQQINMNMNMAAMMQARSPTVSGNTGMTGGAMMSPSPTTPTQVHFLSLFWF